MIDADLRKFCLEMCNIHQDYKGKIPTPFQLGNNQPTDWYFTCVGKMAIKLLNEEVQKDD